MIIRGYTEEANKDKISSKLLNAIATGLNFIDSKSFNSKNINISAAVLHNEKAMALVESLEQIYTYGLLSDLPEEDIQAIRQTPLRLRNIDVQSSNFSWLNRIQYKTLILIDTLNPTPEQDSWVFKIKDYLIVRGKAFDKERGFGRYISNNKYNAGYNLNNTSSLNMTPVYIESSVILEQNILPNTFLAMKENGLTENDMAEQILLHELSHSVQFLHSNKIGLANTGDNAKLPLKKGMIKFAGDSKFLNKITANNIPGNAMLETYADVRSMLMYGGLHPHKFLAMLDATIQYRELDTKGLNRDNNLNTHTHDTCEGLKRLKEKFKDGFPKGINATDIHNISRNLATLNSLAKTEYYLLAGDSIQNSIILNNLTINEKISPSTYLEEIRTLKKTLAKEEGVSNIDYTPPTTTDYRDRDGFKITPDIITEESSKHLILSLDNNQDFQHFIIASQEEKNLESMQKQLLIYGQLPPIEKIDDLFTYIKNKNIYLDDSKNMLNGLFGFLNIYTAEQLSNLLSTHVASHETRQIDKVVALIKEDMSIDKYNKQDIKPVDDNQTIKQDNPTQPDSFSIQEKSDSISMMQKMRGKSTQTKHQHFPPSANRPNQNISNNTLH